MAYLVKQASKYDYKYKEYYIDSESDLNNINIKECCPGSRATTFNSTNILTAIGTKSIMVCNKE